MQESVDEYLAKGYSYSRTNNPTVTVLENKIAELEGGYGADVLSKDAESGLGIARAHLLDARRRRRSPRATSRAAT